MKNKKGFTLVELLSVIAILAVVAGIVSVAYIGISDYIKKTYYKGVEQTLLQAGGEYYAYNKNESPKIFGNEKKVYLDELENGKYITKVIDQHGNACSNESYVGAYKNSLDKVRYYVCLKCDVDGYESDECLEQIDYTLKMNPTIGDTGLPYKEGREVKQVVLLNFTTFNDVKNVIVEANNKEVGRCNLVGNSPSKCNVTITESGIYTYYGIANGKQTIKQDIDIKIKPEAPTITIDVSGDTTACSGSYLKGATATVICESPIVPITNNSTSLGTLSGSENSKTITTSLNSTGTQTITASCTNSEGTTTDSKEVTIKVKEAASECGCSSYKSCRKKACGVEYYTYSGTLQCRSAYSGSSAIDFDCKKYKGQSCSQLGLTYVSGSCNTEPVYKSCANSSCGCKNYDTCCHI